MFVLLGLFSCAENPTPSLRHKKAAKTSSLQITDSIEAPVVSTIVRNDKLWALGDVLIKENESTIEMGFEMLEVQGLFGVHVHKGELFWLEETAKGAILHRRFEKQIQSKSLLWFGNKDAVTSHIDGDTIWLVGNGFASATAMQFAMTGERAVTLEFVKLGSDIIIDAAVDPNGGIWIAMQNMVKRIRKDEIISLDWSNISMVSQLLTTKNRLWILTIDGKLTEVDLETLSIANEISLPGPGISFAHTRDGFYAATGVPNDHVLIHIHRLSNDGTVRWTSAPQPIADRTLVAFDDRVVYGSVEKYVTLEAEKGQMIEETK